MKSGNFVQKKGFTLAEILIAITIIGVISAITLPVLMQNTNKQEYVTALKKAYSTLSQVTNQIIAEEGSPVGDGGWVNDNSKLFELYRSRLNNAKECNTNLGCFAQIGSSGYKFLHGRSGDNWNWNGKTTERRLILSDGMQVLFQGSNIYIDINGEKKPNQFGRDLFRFQLTGNGLHPGGCGNGAGNDDCVYSNGTLGAGCNCACRVLRDGKMDY